MINYKVSTMKTRTLLNDDKDFYIYSEFVKLPRASFQIDAQCPEQYKHIIVKCIDRGWLKPVAIIRDMEYTFEKLVQP